ncbi:hypothetical protein LSH36_696g01059 [Paralvinella palmiformis]|uniref:GSKIP domain-containing protein n=1 Tax=Paralvinella palmiformis TaxID=53620 RepID=A0AAD9J325_9ANNE|nr:hypothetical protein LSH36_696g01059 [Paralvinella palmiformis]
MDAQSEENLLRIEAEDVMKDVRYAVKSAELSSRLPSSSLIVYINLTTKEDERYCVELSLQGFRVVGHHYDNTERSSSESCYYETIYALLDNISPKYQRSFGEALMNKLSELQEEQRQEADNT